MVSMCPDTVTSLSVFYGLVVDTVCNHLCFVRVEQPQRRVAKQGESEFVVRACLLVFGTTQYLAYRQRSVFGVFQE